MARATASRRCLDNTFLTRSWCRPHSVVCSANTGYSEHSIEDPRVATYREAGRLLQDTAKKEITDDRGTGCRSG